MSSVFSEQILADKLSKLNSTQQCIESILYKKNGLESSLRHLVLCYILGCVYNGTNLLLDLLDCLFCVTGIATLDFLWACFVFLSCAALIWLKCQILSLLT